jgi:DNA adenine methylase
MRPLLKWEGGKRALIEDIVDLLPADYKERRYHEPFFGGGTVFFHIEPEEGSINVVNPRLINFYRNVRDRPTELIEEASNYRYEEEEFYKRRDRFNTPGIDEVEDAALFIYLNKTAYNGLYRVNSKGEFNVPFGMYRNPTIVPIEQIMETHELLKNVKILCGDFSYVLDEAEEEDVCYMDPPYHPSSETANFTDYFSDGFKKEEQERLRDLCVSLDRKGVTFVLSNSNTEMIRELYQACTGFKAIPLDTMRMISRKVSSRDSGQDLLITNNV